VISDQERTGDRISVIGHQGATASLFFTIQRLSLLPSISPQPVNGSLAPGPFGSSGEGENRCQRQ